MAPRKPRNTPGATPASPKVQERQKQLNAAKVGGGDTGASGQSAPIMWGKIDLPAVASAVGIDITKPYQPSNVIDKLRIAGATPDQIKDFVLDGDKALQWLQGSGKGVQIVTKNADASTPSTPANVSRKSPPNNRNAVQDAADEYGDEDGTSYEEQVNEALAEGEQAMKGMTPEEARAFLSAAGVHGTPKSLELRNRGTQYTIRYRRPEAAQAAGAAAPDAKPGRKKKGAETEKPAVDPNWRQKQDQAVRDKYEQQGVNAPFYATWGNTIRRNAPSLIAIGGGLGAAGAVGLGIGVANRMMSSGPQQPQQQGYDPDAERRRQLLMQEDDELGRGQPQNPAGMQPPTQDKVDRIQRSRSGY